MILLVKLFSRNGTSSTRSRLDDVFWINVVKGGHVLVNCHAIMFSVFGLISVASVVGLMIQALKISS